MRLPLDWILYGIVLAAVLGAVHGLRLLTEAGPAGRRRARERLKRHTEGGRDLGSAPGILAGDTRRGMLGIWFGGRFRRPLELFLVRAGMKIAPVRFLALSATLGAAGGAAGRVLDSLAIGAGVASLLGALPWFYAGLLRRARMKLFEAQLPEALDLICRALRAGISLEFGLRSVGQELPDPIGTEFTLVADEVSLGLDIRTALVNLATRMNTSDMPFFVNAITIQRETGGNLAEILDNLGRIVRDRIKFYGKVKSLVAQVNLTANLLALMPLAFGGGMLVVNPGYLDPLFAPEGRIFLYGSAVMVPLGWLACKKIASIDL